MAQSRSLASLSSSLLARKGTARPAMRPQGFGGFGQASSIEDLGWNDMGPEPDSAPVPPVLVERAALSEEIARVAPAVTERAVSEPAVTERAVSERAVSEPAVSEPAVSAPEPPVAVKPISLATATRIGRESAKQTKGSKAAFTLRLDADRHLRLRLASAVSNRSSQHLVAQALDAFLQTLPEVEALAAQLPQFKTR